jgi:hypothetical protein
MKPLIFIALLLTTFTLVAQKPYYVDANLQKAKKKTAVYQITVTPRDTAFYVVAEDLEKHKIWQGAFKDKNLKVKHGFYTQFANNQRTVETFYKDNLKDGEERFFNEAGKTKQMQFYIKGVNVTPLQFNDSDLAIVIHNSKFGLANKYGELIVPIEYDYIGKKEALKLYIATKKGASALFDLQGQVKIKTEYDKIFPFQDVEGKIVLQVYKNDLSGLVNLQNEVIIAPKYDEIVYRQNFKSVDASQKVVGIKKEKNKVLIYNTKGELLVSIADNKNTRTLADFYWDLIKYDNIGKNILLYNKSYDDEAHAGAFSLDKAVDIPFEFQEVRVKHQNLPNLAKKGGKYGYIDLKGKVLIPFQYDDAENFDAETQTAYVFVKEQRLKINKKGVVLAKDKKQPKEQDSETSRTYYEVADRRREYFQELTLVNTIEVVTKQKPFVYQIYEKQEALQVKYENKIVANFIGSNIDFVEDKGIFTIYLSKEGKTVVLNPLLKPLFLFEYDRVEFY